MLNGCHVRWVCWPCKKLRCFQLPGIVYRSLQHETGEVVDEWQNLCSLSITYACPYHNPTDICSWATRSTTLTSANSYTLCLPFALYSENQDSSVKRTPLQSARRHRMWAFAHSSQLRRRTSGRSRPQWGLTSMQMSFPETVSDSLRRNYLVMQQTDVAAAVRVSGLRRFWRWRCLDVEVLGWCGYTWSAVVSTGCTHIHVGCWMYCQFPKTPLETAYGGEMNIQFTDNSSGGHSAVSMPIARSLKIAVALWPLFSSFLPWHQQSIIIDIYRNIWSELLLHTYIMFCSWLHITIRYLFYNNIVLSWLMLRRLSQIILVNSTKHCQITISSETTIHCRINTQQKTKQNLQGI